MARVLAEVVGIATTLIEMAERAALRQACRDDLFFLLVFICGRRDLELQYFLDRCDEVAAAPDGHLDLWAREHGKDLACDTPILTPSGWKLHGDLAAGDLVYAPSGQAVRVLAVTEHFSDNPCRLVRFSDGAQIVAGAGHLWRVRRKIRRRVANGGRVIEWAEEICETDDLPLRADVGALLAPVGGIPQQFPVDPYVLGVWLGDGTTGHTTVTSAHSDADEMQAMLQSRGVVVNRRTHTNAVTLRIGNGKRGAAKGCRKSAGSRSDFLDGLRAVGVATNKHIPEAYLRASAHQRMMLLRGLMDTDGSCNDRGTAEFSNTNEALVQGVYELAAGLALRPRLLRYAHHSRVLFQAHKDRVPFLMQRKVSRAIAASAHRNCRDVAMVESVASVATNCIQVEGDLYLAGRMLVPTHNSSIITFGLSLQDILRDPEVTIGVFSHTRPNSKAFLKQIKRELEGNRVLIDLFPDILWDKPSAQAPQWSEDGGLIVKRLGNPKESTVEAWGLVDGQPIGRHFTVLLYDDVVTAESVTTPDMRAKTLAAMELSYNLGSRGGRRRMIGTRYHYQDAYKALLERGTAIPRIHPAEVDGKPTLLTKDELDAKRRDMGPYTFGAQLMLDPKSDDSVGFQAEWIRRWQGEVEVGNRYLVVDPANSKKKGSDYTAAWVVSLGSDENYYILDIVRERLNLPERIAMVIALHRKWKPKLVGYEQYGLQADIEAIRMEQNRVGYRFPIQEMGGSVAKFDRIMQLQPLFAAGRMFLPGMAIWAKDPITGVSVDMVKTFEDDEFNAWPYSAHDDMLDALARIVELGSFPPSARPTAPGLTMRVISSYDEHGFRG